MVTFMNNCKYKYNFFTKKNTIFTNFAITYLKLNAVIYSIFNKLVVYSLRTILLKQESIILLSYKSIALIQVC